MPRTVSIAPGAELPAQVADVDVDHVGAGVVVVAPDVREQLLAAQHLAGVAHQDLEHGELARGQVDGASVRAGPAGAQVEHDAPAASTVRSTVPSSRRRARTRARSSSKRNGLVM